MAGLILPDSNVYIDCLRVDVDPFQKFAGFVEEWEFATCGMVILEVCRGFKNPKILQHFRERFGVMIYIPTTNAIWKRATHLGWSLDRQGWTLPAPDLVIATCALQSSATVLTRDAHFRHVPGLKVRDRLED